MIVRSVLGVLVVQLCRDLSKDAESLVPAALEVRPAIRDALKKLGQWLDT